MEDNRQYNRYSITCNGNISDGGHQNYQFIMNDISAGGMKITTDREMKDESPITIELDTSQMPLPVTKQLQGMVVRKTEDQAAFVYGVQFYGLTKNEETKIDEYLRDSHISSLANMVENPKK